MSQELSSTASLKNHFIEAKIYKNIRIGDATTNPVSTSTWLCVISNMKNSSHKA